MELILPSSSVEWKRLPIAEASYIQLSLVVGLRLGAGELRPTLSAVDARGLKEVATGDMTVCAGPAGWIQRIKRRDLPIPGYAVAGSTTIVNTDSRHEFGSQEIDFGDDGSHQSTLLFNILIEERCWQQYWSKRPNAKTDLLVRLTFNYLSASIQHQIRLLGSGQSLRSDMSSGYIALESEVMERVDSPRRLIFNAAVVAITLGLLMWWSLHHAPVFMGAHAISFYTVFASLFGVVFIGPSLRTAITLSGGARATALRYPELYLDPFFSRRLRRRELTPALLALVVLPILLIAMFYAAPVSIDDPQVTLAGNDQSSLVANHFVWWSKPPVHLLFNDSSVHSSTVIGSLKRSFRRGFPIVTFVGDYREFTIRAPNDWRNDRDLSHCFESVEGFLGREINVRGPAAISRLCSPLRQALLTGGSFDLNRSMALRDSILFISDEGTLLWEEAARRWETWADAFHLDTLTMPQFERLPLSIIDSVRAVFGRGLRDNGGLVGFLRDETPSFQSRGHEAARNLILLNALVPQIVRSNDARETVTGELERLIDISFPSSVLAYEGRAVTRLWMRLLWQLTESPSQEWAFRQMTRLLERHPSLDVWGYYVAEGIITGHIDGADTMVEARIRRSGNAVACSSVVEMLKKSDSFDQAGSVCRKLSNVFVGGCGCSPM